MSRTTILPLYFGLSKSSTNLFRIGFRFTFKAPNESMDRCAWPSIVVMGTLVRYGTTMLFRNSTLLCMAL